MGRKNNVNPAHYKTAGRELPGQAVDHEVNRQKFAEARAEDGAREFANGSRFIPGKVQESITSSTTENDLSGAIDQADGATGEEAEQ
jgi:predicted transcriptional regulator